MNDTMAPPTETDTMQGVREACQALERLTGLEQALVLEGSIPVPTLAQRILRVMHDVRSVDKSAKHAKGYNYSGHDAVTDALRDAMVEHGIISIPNILGWKLDAGTLALDVEVVYMNVDNDQDRFVCRMLGLSVPMNKEGRAESVQPGIALSYAQKCADLKVFRLIGDKTPDAERETDPKPPPAPEKPALSDQEAEEIRHAFERARLTEELLQAKSFASTLARTRRLTPEQMQMLVQAQAAAVARCK